MEAVPDADEAAIIVQHGVGIQHFGVAREFGLERCLAAQGSSSFSSLRRCGGKLDSEPVLLRMPRVFAMRKFSR
jgi:hypothetical protein